MPPSPSSASSVDAAGIGSALLLSLSSYAPAHIETTVQYADKAIAEARATPDAKQDALARFAISRLVIEMERTMVRLVSWNVRVPPGSRRHRESR